MFFTTPIFSRILGTGNYGIVSTYSTWVSIVATAFPLSVGASLGIAINRFSEEESKKYESSVLLLGWVAYLLFSIITILLSPWISKVIDLSTGIILLLLLQGAGTYAVNYANGIYIYEFRADKNFWLSAVVTAATIVLSLVLLKQFPPETNYYGRIIGLAVPYFVIGVIVSIPIFKNGKAGYQKKYWMYALPISVPIVFHSLSNLILSQSDRVMIRAMVSDSESGIYSLAYTFGSIITVIYYALNNSWIPFYYRYTKDDEIGSIRRHSRNYMELFTVVIIGFMLLFKDVYYIFADRTYWSGEKLIPIFLIGFYFIFLYSFPVNYEFYYKKTYFIAAMTVAAAIINIILNYVLIKRIGATGAAIASSVAYIMEFVFHFIYASCGIKEGQFPYKISDFIPCTVAFAISYIAYPFLEEKFGLRLIICFILSAYILIKIYKRREIF